MKGLILLLLCACTVVSAAPESAVDVARGIQRKYDATRSFATDFVHTYEGGVLRKKVTERGTLVVKKPGRMRWSYTSPEEKLFVSDGRKMYAYVPADRQVVVTQVPEGDRATAPVLFLAGKGNLTRDFEVTFAEGTAAPANSYALRLAPKRREPEYDWLVLFVDRQTLQLRGLSTRDQQGGTSTFTFSKLQENVTVPDNVFSFKVPRGVEVVENTP